MNLRRLNIGMRLGIGLGSITLFMLVLIVLGSSGMRRIDQRMNDVIEIHNTKIWNANVIKDALHTVNNSILTLILSPGEKVKAFESVKIMTARASYAGAIEELEKLENTEKGKDILARLRKEIDVVREGHDRTIETALNGRPEHAALFYLNSMRKPTLNLYQICGELVTYEKDQSYVQYQDAVQTYRRTQNIFIIIGGIAVLSVILTSSLLTRSIVHPIGQGVHIADKLAEGDFSVNIEITSQDEPGRLLSAMKHMAERLKETKSLEQQLLQSQKLENVGRLAGGVAHDFNNLLTVIKGYSDMALMSIPEGNSLREDITEIKKASERASNLTRQLLAFSRRQVMEMKMIDLNELLKDMEKMLRRLISEDIELRTVKAVNLGTIKADPGQIEQVLLNLAVNAKDAMPSGGVLTIETAGVELDEDYCRMHMGSIPGPYVLLCVSDTGIGMTPEVKERIFEPFFTTKEKGKGTGLGLATVYGIVKQSGGYIWVYSEPNQGTTFKIYLPMVEGGEADLTQGLDKSSQSLQGNETVLLVEDESSLRKLVSRILREYGYTVIEASDGVEAMTFFQEHQENGIELLLTDVIMPKMGGKELADHIRSSHPDTKVLFMSGYTYDVIAHHGVLKKGIDLLQKPFTSITLAQKVRDVLNKASSINQ